MLSKLIYLFAIFLISNLFSSVSGQSSVSNTDDQDFIDQVRSDLKVELSAAESEFTKSVQLAQKNGRKYVGIKLKENLFKELVELEKTRKKRERDELFFNDDEDEDGEDGEDKESATNGPTSKPVILQTADLLKVIFGPSGVKGLVKGVGGKSRDLRPAENTEIEKIVDILTAKSSVRISHPYYNLDKNPLIKNPEEMYKALGSGFLHQMGYDILKGQLPSDKNLFHGARSAFLVNAILQDFTYQNAYLK